jgi:hypothetical protein
MKISSACFDLRGSSNVMVKMNLYRSDQRQGEDELAARAALAVIRLNPAAVRFDG